MDTSAEHIDLARLEIVLISPPSTKTCFSTTKERAHTLYLSSGADQKILAQT